MSNNLQGGLDNISTSFPNPNLTEKDKMITTLESFITSYEKDKAKFVLSPECFDNILGRIKRSRKEFESSCFFVLIVGPLKSGKSTFVNILSRTKVSPTDVLECTAIPTIIGKADREHLNKITQYFPKKNQTADADATELKIKIFDNIVDVLRGIEDKSSLNNYVNTKSSDATEDNINDIVILNEDAGDNEKSLIATIGIEGCNFIDNEIMIIDMPGLDGKGVNDHDPLYHKMVERADFIFFVQSSTAAINEATGDFLEWLLRNKLTEVPLRLIHNLHESLYYLKDEVTRKMVARQVEAGKRYIKEKFNIQNDFDNYTLNFAKIHKGLMPDDSVEERFAVEVERAVNEYVEIEKQIVDKLKSDRKRIKDKNSVNKGKGNIDISIRELSDLSDKISLRLEYIKGQILLATKYPNNVLNQPISYAELLQTINDLLVSESTESAFERSLENKTTSELGRGGTITGKNLKAKINNLSKSYIQQSPIGDNTPFRQSLLQDVQKLFSTTYADVINEILGFVKTHSIIDVNIDDKIADEDIPCALSDFTMRDYDILERNIWTLNIKQKTYTDSEHSEYLTKYKNYCKEEIPTKIFSYKEAIKTSLTAVRGHLINSINEQFAESLKSIIEKLKNEQSLLTEQQKLIIEMTAKLNYNEN